MFARFSSNGNSNINNSSKKSGSRLAACTYVNVSHNKHRPKTCEDAQCQYCAGAVRVRLFGTVLVRVILLAKVAIVYDDVDVSSRRQVGSADSVFGVNVVVYTNSA